jgi:hypothetical protein
MRGPGLLLTGLLLLSGAQAEPMVLYAHFWHPAHEFVLQPQEPAAGFVLDQSIGAATLTTSCLPETPVAGTARDFHTQYGVPSPVRAEYDGNGSTRSGPRFLPVGGLAADVGLDEAPMVLHWYWIDATLPPAPGAAPSVVVQATLRAGNTISTDDRAFNEGALLAHGRSPSALLAGPLTQGVEHGEVGGRTVYHFVVPMRAEADVLPRATGFNLRVDTFVESPACGEGRFMPNGVHLYSDASHRPRLEFGQNPLLSLEGPHVEANGTDLVLALAVVDPWGADGLAGVGVRVTGPGLDGNGTPLPPRAPSVHCHCYGQAESLRFAVPLAGPLQNGTYVVHVEATTREGRSQAWDVPLTLGQASVAMPGPGLGAAALALAGAAFLAAWKRSGPPAT